MEYLHEKEIVHRYIKLENILLHFPGINKASVDLKIIKIEDCEVKIADFGQTKQLSSVVMGKTQCGTPYTMAPELIHENSYKLKVDLWSLGIITYQMLFGDYPFKIEEHKGISQLFTAIVKGKYSYHASMKISYEAITFVNGLLQLDPEKRMSY